MNKIKTTNKEKILKMIAVITLIFVVALGSFTSTVNAELITDYTGEKGDIGSSTIFTGLYDLIANLAGTLQWVIPIAGVAFIMWYVFRIMTGDEQDQQRYKKGLIKVLICIVVAEMAVVLINLIAGYFGV